MQRCTFLRVRESILKCRLPSGSSDRWKPTTEFFCLGRGVKCGLARPPAHPEDCWRSMPTLFRPTTHSAKIKNEEKRSVAGGNGGIGGQPARHCRVRLIQTRRPVDQFPVPLECRVKAGLESVTGAHGGSATQLAPPPSLFAVVLVHPVAPLLRTSASLRHFSGGLLIEMRRNEQALKAFFFFFGFSRNTFRAVGPIQVCRLDTTDLRAHTFMFVFCFLCLFCSVCLTPTYLLCFDTLLCGHASSCFSITVKRHRRGESSSIFPACEEACLLELHRFAVKSHPDI